MAHKKAIVYLLQESRMGTQRILGIVLLVVGVVVLVLGMNASHSVADQVSNTFTGRFTQATTWYIIGGGAAALFGLLLVLIGSKGENA
jgi:drug/metabolite transporter (DMT)-like permease